MTNEIRHGRPSRSSRQIVSRIVSWCAVVSGVTLALYALALVSREDPSQSPAVDYRILVDSVSESARRADFAAVIDEVTNLQDDGVFGQYEDEQKAELLYLRALAFGATGASENAVSDLEQSVAQAPGDPKHLVALAWAYLEVGRSDEALMAVLAALQTDPDNSHALELKTVLDGEVNGP